jgi:hypothetical protein
VAALGPMAKRGSWGEFASLLFARRDRYRGISGTQKLKPFSAAKIDCPRPPQQRWVLCFSAPLPFSPPHTALLVDVL